MNIKAIEENTRIAILQLRQEKFTKGYPFMINVHDLPADQCYLEHANGTIELVTLSPSRMHFEILRVLPYSEAKQLRKTLGLTDD